MNEKSLNSVIELKRNYFLSGPVILKAEEIFGNYFNVEKWPGCKLFFYKNNIYLLDEINTRIHKYEKGPGLKTDIFKIDKSDNVPGMTVCWNSGENEAKYFLVLLKGPRKFRLLNLENDGIDDEFTLDCDGNILEHKFCILDNILYIGFANTLFIKRIGDDRVMDGIPVPPAGKGSLLSNIYTAEQEIFLTSFRKESRTTVIYRFHNGTFDKVGEIYPFISNFDTCTNGDIFSYGSFDQTIRKFDANWNLVFRHRLDNANADYRGMVVIDKHLYLTVSYCSNTRYILKYDINMN